MPETNTTTNPKDAKREASWIFAAIGILTVALIAVLIWFGLGVMSLYRTGSVSPAIPYMHRPPLNKSNLTPDKIQGWMTFRYVNFIFHLPQGYLASSLSITGTSYQNKTLDAYAKSASITSATFLAAVKSAVAAYQANPQP